MGFFYSQKTKINEHCILVASQQTLPPRTTILLTDLLHPFLF